MYVPRCRTRQPRICFRGCYFSVCTPTQTHELLSRSMSFSRRSFFYVQVHQKHMILGVRYFSHHVSYSYDSSIICIASAGGMPSPRPPLILTRTPDFTIALVLVRSLQLDRVHSPINHVFSLMLLLVLMMLRLLGCLLSVSVNVPPFRHPPPLTAPAQKQQRQQRCRTLCVIQT